MKRETTYVVLAGCALFCLVFYASFRYFSPPAPPADSAGHAGAGSLKPIDAAMKSGSVPARTVDAAPVPEKEPSPSSAAAAPLQATPTSYGTAVGSGSQASSSPEKVIPPMSPEATKAALEWRERRKLKLEQRRLRAAEE
jgi:hypothetical protein